jgi:hypothetical protein
MSAHAVLTEAVEAVLGAHPGLGIAINGVFDAAPARAVRPFAVVEDPVLADHAAAAVAGLPRELGEGWRIASLAFLRSRIFREGPGLCAAVVEFRVRMLQTN